MLDMPEDVIQHMDLHSIIDSDNDETYSFYRFR